MAKKSFKEKFGENPVSQFISAQGMEQDHSKGKSNMESSTDTDVNSKSHEEIQPVEKQPRSSFDPPAGYKINQKYLETRSSRVQLLIPPSVHSKLKEMAKKSEVSLNEYINRLFAEHISNK